MTSSDYAVEAKSILASKTFWANIIGLVAFIMTKYGYGLPPEIATPEAVQQTIETLMPVLNIFLRTITTQPVKIL